MHRCSKNEGIHAYTVALGPWGEYIRLILMMSRSRGGVGDRDTKLHVARLPKGVFVCSLSFLRPNILPIKYRARVHGLQAGVVDRILGWLHNGLTMVFYF
jgi:hypothetical protein